MKILKLLSTLSMCLFLSACVTTGPMTPEKKEEMVASAEETYEMELHLRRVMYPILKNNLNMCNEYTHYDLGIRVWTAAHYQKNIQMFLGEVYDLDNHASVYMVVPKSPAARAGIQPQDKLISMNDKKIKLGISSVSSFYKELKMLDGSAVTVTVERKGVLKEFNVTPEEVCTYPIQTLAPFGAGVFDLTKAPIYMRNTHYDSLKTDEKIAAYLAHEMAHQITGQAQRKNARQLGTALLVGLVSPAAAGGVAGSSFPYSSTAEKVADYVAVYILHNAGYSYKGLKGLEKHIEKHNLDYEDRDGLIDRAYAELKKKKAAGEEIFPEIDRSKMRRPKKIKAEKND